MRRGEECVGREVKSDLALPLLYVQRWASVSALSPRRKGERMDAKTQLANIRATVTPENETAKIWEALEALAHKIDVTPEEIYKEQRREMRKYGL